MEFSLENPGFSLDVFDEVDIHQPDMSWTSSGSSASSGDSTRRSSLHCHGRMSSFSLDRHMFCTQCLGSECDQSTRCDECLSCTKEEMDAYINLRKSLSSKSKNKKSSLKTSSSPPRSTAPDSDIDLRLSAQLITVNKTIDDKISAMSNSLMSQFSEMLASFKSRLPNTSFPVDPAVPGQSVSHTESPSLRYPVSTEYQCLRFQGDGVDPVPHGSGLAQNTGTRSDSPAGPRVAFAQPLTSGVAHDPDEDDDDDFDNIVDPPVVDKTLTRLFNFMYDKFVDARPLSDTSAPPHCAFEEYFAIADPPTSARQRLRVYPRVTEILDASTEKASRLARESKPLHKVMPLRRKIFHVADDQDFCAARFVNPDFACISNSKNILKSRLSFVSLADLEKIERAGRTVIAGDSQCFWLLSSLLAQLKEDGFRPSDPTLFDKNISALPAALASQTTVATGLTDFVTSKRRESYLAHTSCPITESQKQKLLVAPGTGSLLFDQPLLEKIVSQLKEDSLFASSVSSNLSKAAGRGRPSSSSGDRYSSSLEQSRPGPSGYHKRSASPACGSFAKHGRRGRGMSPSSNRGKGFWK